jgi:hypothetical protein
MFKIEKMLTKAWLVDAYGSRQPAMLGALLSQPLATKQSLPTPAGVCADLGGNPRASRHTILGFTSSGESSGAISTAWHESQSLHYCVAVD